jgi:hypothetical protein
MSEVNIGIKGSKGSIAIVLDVLPDNLAELLTLANKIVNGDDAEAALSGLDKQLLGLIRAGTLLQAVKLKKDTSGIGLKEAKDYCDDLKDRFVKK